MGWVCACLFLAGLEAVGQRKVERFLNSPEFHWVSDTLEEGVLLHYEQHSYAAEHAEQLRQVIGRHLQSTVSFMGMDVYHGRMHYFVVEDRMRMKALVGYETNGNADPRNNLICAIYSSGIKSTNSNHELFHLLAMQAWGRPDIWINEGMAVYADGTWHGHGLHQLAACLIQDQKGIPLKKMIRHFHQYDSMITYPLAGSIARFLDETYGREAIMLLWTKGQRALEKHLGKNLAALEAEWLRMLSTQDCGGIAYPGG